MKVKNFFCGTALCLLAGCVGREQKVDLQATEAKIEGAKASLAAIAAEEPVGVGRKAEGLWLGGDTIYLSHGGALPPGFDKVSIAFPGVITIDQFAARVQEMTGLSVRVEGSRGQPKSSASATPGPVMMDSSGMPVRLPGASVTAATEKPEPEVFRSVKAAGSLDEVLSGVTSQFGYDWSYEGGVIRIFKEVTETWTILAPDQTEFSAAVENMASRGGSAGGQGGGSGSTETASSNGFQSTQLSLKKDYWADLKAAVEAIVPPDATVVVSQSTSTLTVSAPTWAIREVRDYVRAFNERVSRQVLFTVDIYSVTMSRDEAVGFDASSVFSSLSGIAVNYSGMGQVQGALGKLTASILPSATGKLGAWEGSQVSLEALQKHGTVTLVKRYEQQARNYMPTPFAFTDRVTYLKSGSATTGINGQQTTLEGGTAVTGLVLNVIPNILDDGRISMKIVLNVSELESISTIQSGTSIIQAPKIKSRDVMSDVFVRSGQVIVLSGFEDDKSSIENNKSGFGLPWLGAAKQAKKDVTKVYVVLRPTIVKAPEPVVGASTSGF